jgi:hypothetical protein
VASRLAQAGRQRTCRDDRSDSRQHERDRGKDLGAQLAKPGGGSGIFDVRPRRRAHLFGESTFLIVTSRDDGDLIACDSDAMKRPCRRGSRGRAWKQGKNERMRHWQYVTSEGRRFAFTALTSLESNGGF